MKLLHKDAIAEFNKVYWEVEKKIKALEENLLKRDEEHAANWLKFLRNRFRERFEQDWSKNKIFSAYMELLYDKALRQELRLAGCVYLHIVVDLPVVVAESLDKFLQCPWASKEKPEQAKLSFRNDVRGLFIDLGFAFDEVLKEAGAGGRLMTFLLGGDLARGVIVNWVLGLRNAAWIHGEIMADSNSPNRMIQEIRSICMVTQAFKGVTRKGWKAFFGIPKLMPGLVSSGGILGAIAAALTLPDWWGMVISGVVGAGSVSALLQQSYSSARQGEQAEFGSQIYRHLKEPLLGSMKVRDVIRLLANDGWFQVSQRGSHRQFRHLTKPGRVTVPGKTSDDLPIGTLKSILRQARLEE